MRRIFSALATVLVTLFFLLLFPNSADAQTISCQDFSVDRNSGDINTVFTFTAVCNNSSQTIVKLYVEDPNGNQTGLTHDVTVSATGELSTTVTPAQSTEPGAYSAYLLDANQDLIAGPVVFTITGDSPIGRKVCCSVVSTDANFCSPNTLDNLIQNEPECVVPSGGQGGCPSLCDAISVRTTCFDSNYEEVWLCAAARTGHPALCVNNSGVHGIESAIGCIPIEDANLTTEFFLRWALGVGGGIALFLISISAVKIMTTRGDEKRLQDARDTLTAAIAGLVLIVLSVFLVRFLTETLLSLF